jgi:hypothetical protein
MSRMAADKHERGAMAHPRVSASSAVIPLLQRGAVLFPHDTDPAIEQLSQFFQSHPDLR